MEGSTAVGGVHARHDSANANDIFMGEYMGGPRASMLYGVGPRTSALYGGAYGGVDPSQPRTKHIPPKETPTPKGSTYIEPPYTGIS